MDEINWFIDYYSDIFFQTLNACLAVVYLENVEAYENDSGANATNRAERKGGRASELSSQKQGWEQKNLPRF